MGADETLPPGPDQMLSLANLVPLHAPHSLETRRALKPLVDTLQAKWVRDFLFTKDSIHIQHLLSPTLPSNSLTCFLGATSVDPHMSPPLSSCLPGESYHMAGHALYTPAFTVDSVTVGVGVIDAFTSVRPFLAKTAPGFRLRTNLRFARDAKTSTLVTVYDAPADNCFVLQFMALRSSTMAHNFTGFFLRNRLLDIIGSVDGPVTEQHLLASVARFQSAEHHRICAVCGALPTSGCGCRLSLQKPRHPYDKEHFMSGMFQHVCASQGITIKVMFYGNGKKSHVVLGSRIFLQGITDSGVLHRLRSWSIAQHANAVTEDPLQSLLMLGNVEEEHPFVEATACRKRQDRTATEGHPSGLLPSAASGTWQNGSDLLDEHWHRPGKRTSILEELYEIETSKGHSSSMSKHSAKLFPSPDEVCGRDVTGTRANRRGRYACYKPKENSAEDKWWEDKARKEIPTALQGSPDIENDRVGAVEEPAINFSNDIIADDLSKSSLLYGHSEPIRSVQGTGSCQASEFADASGSAGASRPAAAGGSAGANGSAGASGPADGNGSSCLRGVVGAGPGEVADPKLLEKQRKAELRREKNREAARRSNSKYRERRDAIREQLRIQRKRIPELREKELALRKENLDLRETLAKPEDDR